MNVTSATIDILNLILCRFFTHKISNRFKDKIDEYVELGGHKDKKPFSWSVFRILSQILKY